jgi:hypothetical protein
MPAAFAMLKSRYSQSPTNAEFGGTEFKILICFFASPVVVNIAQHLALIVADISN